MRKQPAASEESQRPSGESRESALGDGQSLWQMDFAEITGHNIESRGRKEVNRLLEAGWRLLHIYTLRYEENGVWRERPMAILGRLRNDSQQAARETPNRSLDEAPSRLSRRFPAK